MPWSSSELLKWPFDPTSVTMAEPDEFQSFRYTLNTMCRNIEPTDIAKGKKIGRLTFWDVVKIDSMYCPERVPIEAETTVGPCERKSRSRFAFLRSRRFQDRAAQRRQKHAQRTQRTRRFV
uniref:Uncharacterized protein n=1 Tax=Plectus sambesii TaxID=2011161 RepID=A0A914XQ03_9BILA